MMTALNVLYVKIILCLPRLSDSPEEQIPSRSVKTKISSVVDCPYAAGRSTPVCVIDMLLASIAELDCGQRHVARQNLGQQTLPEFAGEDSLPVPFSLTLCTTECSPQFSSPS